MDFEGQYLAYDEYQELGGSLEETPFNILEFEARKRIDEETQARLIDLEEQKMETKMCVFELINLQLSINNGIDINGNVVNYDEKQINSLKKNIIKKCLVNCKLEDGTPYLYCGVR